MVRMNRFMSAHWLRMYMILRFDRHMTARTAINRFLAAGYRSQSPTRRPRLSLTHRRHHREWGQRRRVSDFRHWKHCIFSVDSRFPLYHSNGRARVRRGQGKRLKDACIQPTYGNSGRSVIVWGAIHHARRSNLVFLDGTMSSIATSRFGGVTCYHGWKESSGGTVFVHVKWWHFWTNMTARSWTGHPWVQTWTR